MSAPEDFDELLEILMPWAGGHAVMLRAFIDASTRESDIFCVAGIAFGADRARKAERAWRSLMGERIAHLTDMHARRGAFADFTQEQGGETLKQQVAIINRFASFGVAFSCDLAEMNKLLPSHAAEDESELILDGFRRAYSTLSHLTMHTLGRMAVRAEGAGIAYIFESGDEYQSESSRFIDHATQKGSPLREVYQYRSHGYVDKPDARLLETGDVLAWEWAKHIERGRAGIGMRRSLEAMLGEPAELTERGIRTEKYFCLHVSGAELERFCDKVGRLLLATDPAEVQAIADSCFQDANVIAVSPSSAERSS